MNRLVERETIDVETNSICFSERRFSFASTLINKLRSNEVLEPEHHMRRASSFVFDIC